MSRVLVVTLGATALQAYDAGSGSMQLRLPPRQLLEDASSALPPGCCQEGLQLELKELPFRSGAELTLATLCAVRDAVLAALPACSAAVLLCGTDTLEEAAFLLWLMLSCALRQHGSLLCVTGAMLPADQLGGDGAKNLRDALQVALDPAVRQVAAGQVLAVLNDRIHLAQYVRKADSQLIGAFRSHPGPLGELRGGHPLLWYAPLPPAAPSGTVSMTGSDSPRAGSRCGPAWLPAEEYEQLSAEALSSQRVAIWTLTVDGMPPPEALLQQLDGLVLAGSGTGSLPAAVVEALAGGGSAGDSNGGSGSAAGQAEEHAPAGPGEPAGQRSSTAWTARLPCVIASRCLPGGSNHDDFYYRGSQAKYERRGFVLGRGYEQLNPLQARNLLALRLAAFGHA